MNDGKALGRAIRIAMAAMLAAGVADNALAAEKLGRWTVDIDVAGTQSWKAGSDYGDAKISEHYRIVTHVKAEGDVTSVNTLDPDYAQKQMATALAVQQRVAEAQARQSGGAAIAVPKTPAEQQAFMTKVQQEQQACGNDTACIMQVANKYAPVMSAMAMQAMAGAPGAVPAAPADLDAEPDERFLDYFGYEGCPTEISIHIDNSAEGAYADVGGMVPWKESTKADYAGSDIDRKMQCLNQQTVYDLKDRSVWTHGFGVPAAVGRHAYWDRLHGDDMLGDAGKDTQVSGNEEALEWVAEQLRHAPASGSLDTTLAPKRARGGTVLAGATHAGEIKVKLSWKFEPEVR
jgi:hypothetical protein